jgi:hypothetical protein
LLERARGGLLLLEKNPAAAMSREQDQQESHDNRITQDRQRLVLEAKLKQAQAALDRRVAELAKARDAGAELADDPSPEESGLGSEGVARLMSRRREMYDGAYAELARMRELREQRRSAHVPFRRPPAVMFRHRRYAAGTDLAAGASADSGAATGPALDEAHS